MKKSFDMFYQNGILTVESNTQGPHLAVLAGVHGDEPCGLDALRELIPRIEIERGTITFLLGNKKAIQIGAREYEDNLNRIFRPDEKLSAKEKNTYEYARSRELMKILKEVDVSLDLHSSSTGDTEPFVICEPHSNDIARYLPAGIVISGFDVLHPTGTDAYVNKQGGKGICIECGNHTDDSAKNVAIEAIENILSTLGMKKKGKEINPQKQKMLHANAAYTTEEPFTGARAFADFERVSKDTLIGYDGDQLVYAGVDGVVIFPKMKQVPGKQAFMTAVVLE